MKKKEENKRDMGFNLLFWKAMVCMSVLRNDPDLYKNFVRMTPDDFDYLLNLTTPSIEKSNTNMRESICPGERLAITLRFLATAVTQV